MKLFSWSEKKKKELELELLITFHFIWLKKKTCKTRPNLNQLLIQKLNKVVDLTYRISGQLFYLKKLLILS